MSSLNVPVTRVARIRPHPNADRLEIAEVLGWQVVVKKGEFREGEKVVYFPPDTILPQAVSDRFGVTQYLAKGRIRCAKLRGESSFGVVVRPDDPAWAEGADVAGHYGAAKYFPPIRPHAGDVEEDHPLFEKYTDMEDLRNFPEAFRPGEEVIVTEKVDGTNARAGRVAGEWMAGSHNLRRRKPPEGDTANLYWHPLSLEPVRALLSSYTEAEAVVLFSEVFGARIQDFDYGRKNRIDFLAFDLAVDGRYLDYDDFKGACDRFGVSTVPVLHRGPYSLDAIRRLAEGPTVVGGEHHREGVVVRAARERRWEAGGHVRRAILKYKSDAYLLGGHTDYKDA
ncbi:MAG: RNA ligase (ATP) [Planctomycetes bacterium]|nr:RNA ligase (ATP) [Planctomycetota bacterium]